jgi:hypothetical protein
MRGHKGDLMGVTITGDKDLDKLFNRQPKIFKKTSQKWLTLTAQKTINEWQSAITSMGAIDTGDYRKSISREIALASAEIYTNIEYSVYVELGTSKMPARPAMAVAANKIAPGLARTFTKELRLEFK